MATFEVKFDGIDEMVARMRVQADQARNAAQTVARSLAVTFIGEAKRNATGPPRIAGRTRQYRQRAAWSLGKRVYVKDSKESSRGGGPGVVTGFMRNSIQVRQDEATAGGWEVTVHPGGPYYRRLELGFKGRDSLGRQYDQPAYPFMRPGLDTTRGRASAIARKGFGHFQDK